MHKKLVINKLHNSLNSFEVSIILTETIDDKDWTTEMHIDVDIKKGLLDNSLSLFHIDTKEKVHLLSELFTIAYKVLNGEITSRLVLEEQDIYKPFNLKNPCQESQK